jgi:hypothetical protein
MQRVRKRRFATSPQNIQTVNQKSISGYCDPEIPKDASRFLFGLAGHLQGAENLPDARYTVWPEAERRALGIQENYWYRLLKVPSANGSSQLARQLAAHGS